MTLTSIGTGRVKAGQQDTIFQPEQFVPGKCGVIIHHGATNTPGTLVDPTNAPGTFALLDAIGNQFTMVGGFFDGDQWGNATDSADIAQAIPILGQLGCRTDKVILAGISMGGMSNCGFIRDHPTLVTCNVGLLPASNISDIWNRNVLGLRAEISTAWGTAWPGTLPVNADPLAGPAVAYQTALRTVPGILYGGVGDTAALLQYNQQLAALVGWQSVTVDTGVLDHSEPLVAKIPIPDVLAYMHRFGQG